MEQKVSTSSKRKRSESDPHSMENLRREKAPDTQGLERLRREKAAEYYTMLQSLVPNLFPKATRSKTVDETIKYIQHLEGVVEYLKQRQLALPPQSVMLTQQNSASTVEVTESGNTTFFGMSFVSQPRLLSRVLQVFVSHCAGVLTATVTSDSGVTHITVTAHILEAITSERIKMDLMAI